jgi:CRISPR-associated protein Cmr2
VAFIYADGDGVGSFVESRRTEDDYRKMSKDLRDATWYAVTFALANNLAIQILDNPMSAEETEKQRQRATQPFEIITVGGDDVMLIVPAHVALQIARDMSVKFTEYLETRGIRTQGRPLTLSSGVVIAPQHMPVRLMRDFARELLKKGAKPRAKETPFAAVDFQIFTSAAVYGSDIMSMRAQSPYSIQPLDNPEEKPLHLYRRPYTIPELSNLLDALKELNSADFPTSQLYPLAGALERGRRRATLFYLYQRSRIKDKAHRAALVKVEAIIQAQEKRDPLPWYKADPGATYTFNTTLRDVAELYDFVEAREEVTA